MAEIRLPFPPPVSGVNLVGAIHELPLLDLRRSVLEQFVYILLIFDRCLGEIVYMILCVVL
jgi:hypothetical protein